MTGEASPAVLAAREAQARLDQCLAEGTSFRLEAGAGAGKTYSLVAALKKIIAERSRQLTHAGQRVACITYTEVAREEIAQEIEAHPAILVDTIHGFGWSFMSRFQKALRELVAAQPSRLEAIEAAGGVREQTVEYNLGFFGIDDRRITLGHDDVPAFFAEMLRQDKFRKIFESLYPIVFVDEYQDTDPLVMGALKEYVLEAGRGPLIGLFGDHWQTIYRKDYELIDFPGVTGIDKGSNFRSTPAIVDVLNRLRPELRQEVDNPAGQGEARFFHCNGFEGQRVSTTHARGELPPEQHALALQRVMDLLVDEGWHFGAETTKVLMLTHNAIAAGRGYPTIAKIFDHKEAFAKKEDAAIAFLADVVEPACAAYAAARYGAMFQTMGGIPTIRRAADKIQWRADMDALLQLRQNATIGEVIDHLKATRRPRLSDQVQRREDEIAQLGLDPAEDESKSLKRHRALRAVPYRELISVAEFINGFTPFATQHSVKGAEFDNVLVVLSGGWNQYNWPKLLENLTTNAVPARELEGYYRARNLLYVALSRPKKRLAVLATQQLSARALEHAAQLFTEAHVVALPWD